MAVAGAVPVMAAELELEGNKLRVIGVLDGSGLPAFVERVDAGRVRTVVFEDSPGGDVDVADAYARVIRDKGLLTEARGVCQAACAYAFLAGKDHRFGRGGALHALVIPLLKRPSAAELQAGRWRSGPATTATAPEVVNVATATTTPISTDGAAAAAAPSATAPKENWVPGQGLVFTSTPTFFGRVYNSYWCDGSQGSDFTRCDRLSDADPYKLGVLTP